MKGLKLILFTIVALLFTSNCGEKNIEEKPCFGFFLLKAEGETSRSITNVVSQVFEFTCSKFPPAQAGKGNPYLEDETAYLEDEVAPKLANFLMKNHRPLLDKLKTKKIEFVVYGCPNYYGASSARIFMTTSYNKLLLESEIPSFQFDSLRNENAISELKDYLESQEWLLRGNPLPEKLSR